MTKPSESKLLAYCQLIRLPNVFTAIADVAAGFLFTHAAFSPSEDGAVMGMLVVASLMIYAAGMVLNDVFDIEIDAVERPDRPLPSGRISLDAARWLGAELLISGMAFGWLAGFFTGDFRPGLVVTLLAGCVLLYDKFAKHWPAGPMVMGACRGLNWLLGMSLAAGGWQPVHGLIAAAIGTYIGGVTWMARNETERGSRWQLASATALILGGIGLLYWVPRWIDPETLVSLLHRQPDRWPLLLGTLGLLIGHRCVRAVLDPSPLRVQTAVKQCILSLIILDGAVCFVVHDVVGAVAIVALLLPTVILANWIYST